MSFTVETTVAFDLINYAKIAFAVKITPVTRLLGVKCDEHLTVADRLVIR